MAGVKRSPVKWRSAHGRTEVIRNGPKMEMAARIQAAISSGRIVPTEARPSELSGCIVGAGNGGVKAKSAWK
jgi:hypothetical protein